VNNESRRVAMSWPVDPQFLRLSTLLVELQRGNGLQIRVDRARDSSEVLDRRQRRAIEIDLRQHHAAVLDLGCRCAVGAASRHRARQLTPRQVLSTRAAASFATVAEPPANCRAR
jgi:hypothetical protein